MKWSFLLATTVASFSFSLCYYILDADEGGRPPKINNSAGEQQADNEYFNWRDKSCLHVIAKSHNSVRLK